MHGRLPSDLARGGAQGEAAPDRPPGNGFQPSHSRKVRVVKSDNNSGFHEIDDDAPPTIPLTIDEWLNRELPPPDRLLGEWLTTTSRASISAATGLANTP